MSSRTLFQCRYILCDLDSAFYHPRSNQVYQELLNCLYILLQIFHRICIQHSLSLFAVGNHLDAGSAEQIHDGVAQCNFLNTALLSSITFKPKA